MPKQIVSPNGAFTLLLRVRYGECDAQEVVFNARYADYIDVAMTEYFRVVVGGFQALLDKGLDNQVVSLHLDWYSSAKFDDVLAINVLPMKVGNTSYQFQIQISQHESKNVVATSVITYVMVDTVNYQKTAVPDWLRSRLSSSQDEHFIVDQAGV
jgi:acyl-CoA thioester hydrolase